MAEKFFLGAMTPNGFSTHISEYVNSKSHYTYILKGGAGTGKSSLMKKIADRFEPAENVTRFYCSSDPDSLDAVVLHSSKAVIVDGTAPHVFDPIYPGVCQKIVNLGYYWNDAMLAADGEKIIAAAEHNKSLMAAAAGYNAALGKVCGDTYACAGEFVDREKLSAFAKRFCKRLFGKSRGSRGERGVRQLSALTRYGYMTFTETLENYLDVYVLSDSCFFAADMFISQVAEQAQALGFDVRLSPCLQLGGQVWEHLLIGELGIAIVSADPLTRLVRRNAQVINMQRFYDKGGMQKYKKRLKTNAALIRELSQTAGSAMNDAKAVHDELESYYIKAMDFDGIARATENIAAEISERGGGGALVCRT